MWSLISGLVVLSIMIIGACIGYVGAYKDRITSEQAWRDLKLYERRPAVRNDTSIKLADSSDSRDSVTISVSPRNLQTVTDVAGPPDYEDLSLPPSYEVAVASPKASYEVIKY